MTDMLENKELDRKNIELDRDKKKNRKIEVKQVSLFMAILLFT